MSLSKDALVSLFLTLFVLQCWGFPQARLPLGLAESRENKSIRNNGLDASAVYLLMVVQSQSALHYVDHDCVQDSGVSGHWTVNRFLTRQCKQYWACPCNPPPLTDDEPLPQDPILYNEIWPNIFHNALSPRQNIEHRYDQEGKCASIIYQMTRPCYNKEKKSFAECYYKQVQLLFTNPGTDHDQATNLQQSAAISNVSEFVNTILKQLFDGQDFIHGLTPEMVSSAASGINVYLGCQQRLPESTFPDGSKYCFITRVGLCFQCYKSKYPNCTPSSSSGTESVQSGFLTSCSHGLYKPPPWAKSDDCNSEKYSCYDQTHCDRVVYINPSRV